MDILAELPFKSLDSACNADYDYGRNYDDGGGAGINIAPYKVTEPLNEDQGQNVSCDVVPIQLPTSPFSWLASKPAVLRICYMLFSFFVAVYGILFGKPHLCLTTEDYVCVTHTAQYYNAHSLYERDSNYRVYRALSRKALLFWMVLPLATSSQTQNNAATYAPLISLSASAAAACTARKLETSTTINKRSEETYGVQSSRTCASYLTSASTCSARTPFSTRAQLS